MSRRRVAGYVAVSVVVWTGVLVGSLPLAIAGAAMGTALMLCPEVTRAERARVRERRGLPPRHTGYRGQAGPARDTPVPPGPPPTGPGGGSKS